jgi:hypothetical protein
MSSIQISIGNIRRTVELDPETVSDAFEIAEERTQLHERHDSDIWTETCEATDSIGMQAELAFEQFYGLEADRELRPTGDEGYDFCVSWGETNACSVDIKGTKYTDPKLMVRDWKIDKTDRFVLITAVNGVCTFQGWIAAEILREHGEQVERYGHTNRELERWQLRPLPPSKRISGCVSEP